MSDRIPEDAGFTPPLFSDDQVHAMCDFVETHGKARAAHQGANFNEYDYLSGAMSMFFALRLQNRMPAGWIFSAFAGRSPLDIEVPDRDVYVVMAGKLHQVDTIYAERHMAVEHADFLSDLGDDYAHARTIKVHSTLDPKVQAELDGDEPDGED